jgi:hypothetical protein
LSNSSAANRERRANFRSCRTPVSRPRTVARANCDCRRLGASALSASPGCSSAGLSTFEHVGCRYRFVASIDDRRNGHPCPASDFWLLKRSSLVRPVPRPLTIIWAARPPDSAEFLTPLVGSEYDRKQKRKAVIEVAGASTQQLRHLELLLNSPWFWPRKPDSPKAGASGSSKGHSVYARHS